MLECILSCILKEIEVRPIYHVTWYKDNTEWALRTLFAAHQQNQEEEDCFLVFRQGIKLSPVLPYPYEGIMITKRKSVLDDVTVPGVEVTRLYKQANIHNSIELDTNKVWNEDILALREFVTVSYTGEAELVLERTMNDLNLSYFYGYKIKVFDIAVAQVGDKAIYTVRIGFSLTETLREIDEQ